MSDVPTINGYAALYADIMAEVKVRHQIVVEALDDKKLDGFPAFMRSETCYLQLRMICELIALGCLVAHRDISATRRGKLKDAWNADLIVSALGKLHPNFYPRPGIQKQTGDGVFEIHPQTSPYLSKGELKKLYIESGNVLHRGNVDDIRSRHIPGNREIQIWANKISALLNHHQIEIAASDLEIWCIMQDKTDGKVHTNVMHRVGLSPN